MQGTKYYKNISELPIANFIEIQKTGNLNYLIKMDFFDVYDIKEASGDELRQVWEDMIYQFDDLDCKAEQMQAQLLALNFDLTVSELNNSGNTVKLINKIRVLEARINSELEYRKNRKSSYDEFETEVAIIEKWLGHAIDMYKMSVKRYMAHRNNYQKYIELTREG